MGLVLQDLDFELHLLVKLLNCLIPITRLTTAHEEIITEITIRFKNVFFIIYVF